MASSSTTLQRMDGVFDPRVAFPAATDAVLDGLRVNLSQRIDWLDDYLQQVKEADVLRTKWVLVIACFLFVLMLIIPLQVCKHPIILPSFTIPIHLHLRCNIKQQQQERTRDLG